MLNYLKSELYHQIHRKAPYLFIIVCSALLIAMNVLLYAIKTQDPSFRYATTGFSYSNIYTNLYIIYFLCVSVCTMIFGNEYQYHTFKNSVSYGVSRSTVYIAKTLLQIIYSLIAFVIIIGCFIISGELLLSGDGTEKLILIRSCFAGLPFFICAICICTAIFSVFESTGISVGAAAVIMLVIPIIIMQLAQKFEIFAQIMKYIPIAIMGDYEVGLGWFEPMWKTGGGMAHCYIVGLVEAAVFFIAGYTIFRKKEIK